VLKRTVTGPVDTAIVLWFVEGHMLSVEVAFTSWIPKYESFLLDREY